MKTMFFKNVKIGEVFAFGILLYLKISNDLGVGKKGKRIFNLLERVSI